MTDLITFIESAMIDPESNPPRPFTLLDCEKRFLQSATMVGADGRLLFPEMVYAAPKKTGKSTFGAICLLAFVLLLGGRFSEGFAIANDFEQAQSKVFEMARRIVEASPALRKAAKITADRITFTRSGSFISAIASEYTGAAGSAPTIVVADELWGFVSERSRRLFDEMIFTPTKKISCRLTVTYAGFDTESELLRSLYDRGKALPVVGPDLHAGDGMLMFWTHKVQAPWQTTSWLRDMERSLRVNQFRRMILNEWVSSESAFVDMPEFDRRCVDPRLTRVLGDRSLSVWAAIDASTKHDSTAMALVTFNKQTQRVQLCDHRVIVPDADHPVEFRLVEQQILEWQSRFKLVGCYYDPFQLAAVSQNLARAGVNMVEYPQTIDRLTAMAENLHSLIVGGNLHTYVCPPLRDAIAHTVAEESARGWKLTKLKQSHRIDLVVALGMACFAAVKAPRTTITVVNMDGQRLDPVTGNPIAPPRTRIRWTDANEDGVVTRTRVS